MTRTYSVLNAVLLICATLLAVVGTATTAILALYLCKELMK